MTLREIERRVSRLSSKPWVVSVAMSDGSTRKMTIKQLMQLPKNDRARGLSFQTVQGGSLRDLDMFLDWIGGVV